MESRSQNDSHIHYKKLELLWQKEKKDISVDRVKTKKIIVV